MLVNIGLQQSSFLFQTPIGDVATAIASASRSEIVEDYNGLGIIAVRSAVGLGKRSTPEAIVDAYSMGGPREVAKRPSQKFQHCNHWGDLEPLAPAVNVNVASIGLPVLGEQGVQQCHRPNLQRNVLGLLVFGFPMMLNYSSVMAQQFENMNSVADLQAVL